MSWRLSLTLVAATVGSSAVAPRLVDAGGFGIPEVGVRRTAMAAVVGRPDEGAALYHNPAGLYLRPGWNVYVSGTLFALGAEFELQQWDQSDQYLGVTANPDGFYDPIRPTRSLGATPMISISGEIIPGKLTLATGLYVGNAQGAAFDKNAITRYHLIDGYIVAPQAVVGASYRITDKIAVGGSVGVIYSKLHGRRELFPIFEGTDLSGIAGTRALLVLDGSGWAPTWVVSAFGQPHPKVTWGATITGRIDNKLTGPVEVTYSDDAPTPGDMLIGTQTTTQLIPWSFLAGVNVDVTPHVELGTEFRYWLYRQYKNQHTDIVGIFLVRELDTVKNFRDSFQTSGGIRVHDLPGAERLDLMAGTHFDRTPAPPTTLTLDQPTFNHIGLHTGARYSVGRYRFGASYIHYWYDVPDVTGSTTSPPTNFRGKGANNIFSLSFEATL